MDQEPTVQSKWLLEELKGLVSSISKPDAERRIAVNKRTHSIHFELEIEERVVVDDFLALRCEQCEEEPARSRE